WADCPVYDSDEFAHTRQGFWYRMRTQREFGWPPRGAELLAEAHLLRRRRAALAAQHPRCDRRFRRSGGDAGMTTLAFICAAPALGIAGFIAAIMVTALVVGLD